MSVTLSGDDPKIYFPDGTVQETAGVPNKNPVFRAALGAATQALSSSTFTKVLLDTKTYDPENAFNLSLSRFQPSVAGYYSLTGNVFASASVGATRLLSTIYKNGAVFAYGNDITPPSGGSAGGSSVASIVYLNGTTDYAELWAYVTATTPMLAGTGGGILTHFSGHLVRAL